MERDLIYDVGLYDGADTAYYLSRGYRVVAIDADASAIDAARARFAPELAAGRLTLVHAAVGAAEPRARFWVCDAVPEWSSLHRSVASQLGLSPRPVEVDCVDFRDVLAEHGVPYYLKVDIEQSDRACIAALDSGDLPAFASLELTDPGDLDALREAGYGRFKIISQTPWAGHAQFRGDGPAGPGVPQIGDVPFGQSGPFGADTDGDWESYAETLAHLQAFAEAQAEYASPDWLVWFDVHATALDPADALRPTA